MKIANTYFVMIRKVRKIGGSILMHHIFGGGNDSHCLPKILNEEKSRQD